MSGKNYKRARQLARKISTGAQERDLVARKNSTQAINKPGTTRAIYREFKRLMRRGITIAQLEESILTQMPTGQ